MEKNEIRITDIQRILFGNAPVEFMLEVLVRTVVTYFFLLLIVRLLGKRMSGQLTILDLAIMLMLGAIVAPPMEAPERGIFQGILILFLVLFCHRMLSKWGVKKEKIEQMMYGSMTILVKDGVLQLDELKNIRVSRSQLFSMLRQKKIYNLGQVERMYLEACGLFSVFKNKENKPGLSLLPPSDTNAHLLLHQNNDGWFACISCGNTKQQPKGTACEHCGSRHWTKAIQ